MSAFDKIIGYTSIKEELKQISDILKNREIYDKLGVSAPRGLLLYGEPGVGKSLMARAVIEDSACKVFCCRKDSPNGDFVKKIKDTFEQAAKNVPAIVYLDDMDKFANGDEQHPNTEEYVTVQSCIDELKNKQVFVLATVNNIHCLPYSLYRAGRFDRKIKVNVPHGKDAVKIIAYYLRSKHFVEEINPDFVAKIMEGCSCAELETVINEAGLYAGYERSESITMAHFLKACLRTVFHISYDDKNFFTTEQDDFSSSISDHVDIFSQIVYHEAGHVVVSEVLCPESVIFVSAYNRRQEKGGFTKYYQDNRNTPLYRNKSRIIASLGGIAAIEQKFGISDMGCGQDLDYAFDEVRKLVTQKCVNGFCFYTSLYDNSEYLKCVVEQVIVAEVEKYYRKAKEVLSSNWEFFEKITAALAEKKLLCDSDIQKIKSECKIVRVAV